MYPLKEISIEVTNNCSLNCIHCSTNAGTKLPNELTLGEIKNILDQGKSLGANIVSLSGGDPILRDDIGDIIKYAQQQEFEIRLQTAGAYDFGKGFVSLPDTFLNYFPARSNNKIIYSLHGLKQTHEKITTIFDCYDITLESIHKTKMHKIFVEVHTVPNKFNYLELISLSQILEKSNIDSWHLLRLVPQGRCLSYPELELNKNEFKKLQEEIITISKQDMKLSLCLGHNIDKRYWLDNIYPIPACTIGNEKILISSDGNVTYCAALKDSNFGNIRINSLEYFWNHQKVNEFRRFSESKFQKIKGKCSRCKQLESCKGGCLAQRLHKYNDIYQGPDPLCCRK